MDSIFGVAQSGLQVASLRLAVSADNVANAGTAGFVPSRIEAGDVPGGGVAGRVAKGDDAAKENDPELEARLDRTIVDLSRTDLVQETVSRSLAAATFRANLATLRTADETLGSVLSLEG